MMAASDSKNKTPPFSDIPIWIPLLAFSLLIFFISATGYVIFEQYKKAITEQEVQNLGAIADLKVAQIVAWREAHRRRAEFFLHGAMLPDKVDQWLREGAPENESKQKILKGLAGIQQELGYKAVSLLDNEGAARISTNDSFAPDMEEKKLAVEAMRSQRVLFSDLHKEGREDNKIAIDSVAPLMVTDEKKSTRIVGALLFEIDPALVLYPLIQSWPTKSQSAETLLVRRDGDNILFLNELRLSKGAALSLRFPLSTPNLVSAKWFNGQFDAVNGVDYRGIPVASAVREVPDTSWLMVAKIDKDELFAPINTLQRWTAGLVFSFSAFGGALVFLWFRGHQARYAHLKTQHDAAVERAMLVKHFDYLTKYANDIVLLANDQGRIVETNDRAALAYGYTKEQLKSMSIGDLLRPGADLRLKEIEKNEELKFESVHVRKNGAAFPVESSVRAITIEGERYCQGIIRDITERKRAETEMFAAKSELAATLDALPDLLFELGLDGRYYDYRSSRPELMVAPPETLIGKSVHDVMPPEAADVVVSALQEAHETGHSRGRQIELQVPQGKMWFELSIARKPVAAGLEPRFIVLSRDITERKQAEEDLWRQKHFIRQVIDTDPNLIFVKDAEGKFLLVNQAMADAYGKAPQELIGQNIAELYPNKAEADRYLEADREVLAARHPVVSISPNSPGGKRRWFLTIKAPMEQPDGTVNVLAIAVDITERKLAEERLSESYQELEKLTTHLEAVREDEQKRIARELHDEMGGVLAALNMKISLMAAHPPTENAELMTEVGQLEKLVAAGIQALHRTVTELRPVLLDEVGLTFAIEKYVLEFEKNTEIECDLHLPEEDLTLDENQSAAIFRIIQESLTNVAKHAQASKVSIVLSEWDTLLVLTIRDNGKGFDLNTQKAKSFGLLGIRERAAMVGGKAEITSAAGKGTTVRVSLPLIARNGAISFSA